MLHFLQKAAKELVAHEITSHIEDQEEAYRAQGLTAYDAERRAVLDMGDPVETGVSLDAVHKHSKQGDNGCQNDHTPGHFRFVNGVK